MKLSKLEKVKMIELKIYRGIIFTLLLMNSSFSFSQDMAGASYRVSLRIEAINLDNPNDSLKGIEFYSGIDGEINCSVAHLKQSRGLLKYNSDSLDFEIFAMKFGIGSCLKKVKPPTIYIKFVIESKSSLSEENFEYNKFIPIIFETTYTNPQFTIDSLDLSQHLGFYSEAVAIKIDSNKNYIIINQVKSNINTMVKYELPPTIATDSQP